MIDPVYIRKLPEIDLKSYDVLLVPRETNQEILLRIRDKLIDFLDFGGTLISFGEVPLQWLPLTVWLDKKIKSDSYRILDHNHPIFKNIAEEDLRWHDESSHGIFRPPKNVTVLVKGEHDAVIMYIDGINFKGSILATTLDPLCHAGYGLKEPKKLLKNILRVVANDELRFRYVK